MTDNEIELALETIALVLEDLKKTQEKQQAAITAIKGALADHALQEVQRIGQEIEQEPAGWEVGVVDGVVTRRLAPPQRTWVDLTDVDRNDCLVEADPCECLATPEAQELMRCVETKLKELNHGK